MHDAPHGGRARRVSSSDVRVLLACSSSSRIVDDEMKDDMPTEVTSTVVGWRGLVVAALAVVGVGAESAATSDGAPWWLVPAVAVIGAAIWWAAVIFVTAMASRAATDGRDDWEDLFWPSLLRLLSQSRYAQVHGVVDVKRKARKRKEPDEGEEKEE
jgi:hypothetical protein